MNKPLNDRYDLFSAGLLALTLIFTLIRFQHMPQFIDAYFHLSSANGFLQSGGWVGWSWWDFSPWGRPQLYPPLYHLILAFLQISGLSGITALRICEVTVPCLFFFSFWYVVRGLSGSLTAFFALLLAGSFFSFYASTAVHVPATFALTLGLWSWYSLCRGQWLRGGLLLLLCFYLHAGISWIIAISLIFALPLAAHRTTALKMLLVGLAGALPMILHQYFYRQYVSFSYWREVFFVHFSPALIVLALAGFFAPVKRDLAWRLFIGFCAGSLLLFCRYPYRFFSAQGVLGLALVSAVFLTAYFSSPEGKKKRSLFLFVCIYFFVFHSTIDLDQGRPGTGLVNSTYSNFILGKTQSLLEFKTLYLPRQLDPLFVRVREYTSGKDIVTSNSPVISQMLTAFTGRANSYPLLREVSPGVPRPLQYSQAKLVVWIKPADRLLDLLREKFFWQKVYENEIAFIFINPGPVPQAVPIAARIPFFRIIFILAGLLAGILCPYRSGRPGAGGRG